MLSSNFSQRKTDRKFFHSFGLVHSGNVHRTSSSSPTCVPNFNRPTFWSFQLNCSSLLLSFNSYSTEVAKSSSPTSIPTAILKRFVKNPNERKWAKKNLSVSSFFFVLLNPDCNRETPSCPKAKISNWLWQRTTKWILLCFGPIHFILYKGLSICGPPTYNDCFVRTIQ